MNRSVDRGSDPSPFAWIFAGALALVGIGSVLAARRSRRALDTISATPDEVSEGHPS